MAHGREGQKWLSHGAVRRASCWLRRVGGAMGSHAGAWRGDVTQVGVEWRAAPLLRRDLESPQAFISQGRPAPGLPARCPSGQSFCPANTGQKPRPKGHIRHREDLSDG